MFYLEKKNGHFVLRKIDFEMELLKETQRKVKETLVAAGGNIKWTWDLLDIIVINLGLPEEDANRIKEDMNSKYKNVWWCVPSTVPMLLSDTTFDLRNFPYEAIDKKWVFELTDTRENNIKDLAQLKMLYSLHRGGYKELVLKNQAYAKAFLETKWWAQYKVDKGVTKEDFFKHVANYMFSCSLKMRAAMAKEFQLFNEETLKADKAAQAKIKKAFFDRVNEKRFKKAVETSAKKKERETHLENFASSVVV